jgi:secretion/DNA translocation related CpaE-like protein
MTVSTAGPVSSGVLALISEPVMRDDVDRVAAAAGVPVVHVAEPSSHKVWTAAAAVLLDVEAARTCAQRGLPRRDRTFLVCASEPRPDDWQTAIAVGARRVLALPAQDGELVTELSEAAEASRAEHHRGPAVTVIGARGGAGASLFAVALARSAPESLLVDADPWGGGIDLVAGTEDEPGLRWPDLAVRGGRLSYPTLRTALPGRAGVRVLSCTRAAADIDAAALGSVIDAGSRGGAAVVCDVPRRSTAAVQTALEASDLVVLVVPADVGVVVRGPAPGGLRAADIGRSVGLPVLAAMRPEPGVAAALERGGLPTRRRSPATEAARAVWTVVRQQPAQTHGAAA